MICWYGSFGEEGIAQHYIGATISLACVTLDQSMPLAA
jgi:hypothetical protein